MSLQNHFWEIEALVDELNDQIEYLKDENNLLQKEVERLESLLNE